MNLLNKVKIRSILINCIELCPKQCFLFFGSTDHIIHRLSIYILSYFTDTEIKKKKTDQKDV